MRRIRRCCFLICLLGIGSIAGLWFWKSRPAAKILTAQEPERRTEPEVLERLKEMGKADRDFQKVYEQALEYPEALLSALANNPEMIDFVLGYPEKQGTAEGALTKKERKEAYPLFLQWDPRWGYASYGSSCIAVSGCGPVCLAMAVHGLTQEKELTPGQVAKFSEEAGYYVEGTGTSWSLMTEGAKAYGLTARELALDEGVMKSELDAGRPIICAMGAGDFTTAGHFILIYGYEKDGFRVNDPNCIARSEQLWSYEKLNRQIKNLWSYEG